MEGEATENEAELSQGCVETERVRKVHRCIFSWTGTIADVAAGLSKAHTKFTAICCRSKAGLSNAVAAVFVILLCAIAAKADVGLLLLESTRIGTARYTAAGHAAIYFSELCAESSVRLRRCRADEDGAVVSTYGGFGENRDYEWNAVPFRVFLYGSEKSAAIPLYANNEVMNNIRQRYRSQYLNDVCGPGFCKLSSERWGDLAAATLTRDVYCFRLRTSPEQNEALLKFLNTDPNDGRYNPLTRNCADFARKLINRIFPGAARPDYINDFLMTSPKAVAKSFVHYGEKHPALGLVVERYTQIAGSIKRSEDNRKAQRPASE